MWNGLAPVATSGSDLSRCGAAAVLLDDWTVSVDSADDAGGLGLDFGLDCDRDRARGAAGFVFSAVVIEVAAGSPSCGSMLAPSISLRRRPRFFELFVLGCSRAMRRRSMHTLFSPSNAVMIWKHEQAEQKRRSSAVLTPVSRHRVHMLYFVNPGLKSFWSPKSMMGNRFLHP